MAIPFKQIGLTAASAGVAAAAVAGAWGAWTTGDANDQASRAGVLDLDFGIGSIGTAFGTVSDPIAPGDAGCRTIQITNDGNVDISGLKLRVDHNLTEGGYSDTAGNGTSNSGANAQDEDVTSDEDELLDMISVSVNYSDGGMVADATAVSIPACGDNSYDGNVAVVETPLSDVDSVLEADTVTTADGAGLFTSSSTAVTEQDRQYLELNYAYDADADETSQNVYGALTWVFTANQRAADPEQ